LKHENLNSHGEHFQANQPAAQRFHQKPIDERAPDAITYDPNDNLCVDPVRLLTVLEVADRLQVPSGWVYRHTRELGGLKLGKYTRFSWPRIMECLGKMGASQ
jgi:hypothetical protein